MAALIDSYLALTASAQLSLGLYLACAALLSVYGAHRIVLLGLYFRHRGSRAPELSCQSTALSAEVLIQLPIYNERHVAERLIDAVAALEWPRNKLKVQVLDDSNDETLEIVSQRCAMYAAKGLHIEHICRNNRQGFKAGALNHGLSIDKAGTPFVAIFDADFIPGADFLQRTIPALIEQPKVGMIQCRWEHLNREQNLLTRLEAILLDGHFVLEHSARYRSGRFFNFNGTAGVWRREAIEGSGGWTGDTLCEDLDLSYRAQLKGWSFIYLQDAAVPAELPAELCAFKAGTLALCQ